MKHTKLVYILSGNLTLHVKYSYNGVRRQTRSVRTLHLSWDNNGDEVSPSLLPA